MQDRTYAGEILRMIQVLPDDKIAELIDYISFLRTRYAPQEPVDASEAWSDEDISELIAASLAHAEDTLWVKE